MVKSEEGTKTNDGERQPMVRAHTRRNMVENMELSKQGADNYVSYRLSARRKFHLIFITVPIVICIWYASAVLYPPGAREKAPFFLWTDGALTYENGVPTLCPRQSICSEGGFQIFLIACARISAFVMYPLVGHTFLSKMHCSVHALSTSYLGTFIPFAELHTVHHQAGMAVTWLGVFHTVTHFIRWAIRGDLSLLGGRIGLSGVFAMIFFGGTVWSMRDRAKKIKKMTFDIRFWCHWIFMIIAVFAICFHTPRTAKIFLSFSGLWAVDYLYGMVFKTYRLDVVEFTPLPNKAGVQMLWRNPPGFNANSGEYVQVKAPWLWKGGAEWHPFSLYLKEATAEGLDKVIKQKFNVKSDAALKPAIGNRSVEPDSTALLLIDLQNEFASKGGKFHNEVKKVMVSSDMLYKTAQLAEKVRSSGAVVFHIPTILDKNKDSMRNKHLGIQKKYAEGFQKGTWNAEIVESHTPKVEDIIIKGKTGLDGFFGTDLFEELEKREIETVIIGGFLTNGCIESTMRTAYEKGFNVLTLTDGTACSGQVLQDAIMNNTFKMFSHTVTCDEAAHLLCGDVPKRLTEAILPSGRNLRLDKNQEAYEQEKNFLEFLDYALTSEEDDEEEKSFIVEEARAEIRNTYNTTQVFIIPAGDWTKRLYEEVDSQDQLRSCWVRGPYISPYSIAADFSHLILIASGIGITPALGVIGQYKGNSRTKILVWSTRSPEMLKFFIPIIEDAHICVIYYTGKVKLTRVEVKALTKSGKIFIQQARPASLTGSISTIISETHSQLEDKKFRSVDDMPIKARKQWCMLYCGGSLRIKDDFQKFSKEKKIKFDFELFNW